MHDFCVCVPVRDEAERIGVLIAALASQSVAGPIPVTLCVNNTDDDTIIVAMNAADRTDGRIALVVEERRFAPDLAHAGSARRVAMDSGAERIGHGVLLSTDADCRPPNDWIAANLAAYTDDRIVGGRILIDDDEPVPDVILSLRQRFDRYWEAVRTIEDAIDPVAWDAAPRHGDHTGASLALGVDLYRRSGGVPTIPVGEDRALVEAAIAVGGRLIHPPSVWTRASARIVGRARGGMAGDMADWLVQHDAAPRVPSFDQWRARAAWRRAIRRAQGDAAIAPAERSLPPMTHDVALPDLHP